ncbi:MAG: CHAT domain-containing protein [Gallionella sp.]|nr:CHAT domain-containing protein [Gallionella sp.]
MPTFIRYVVTIILLTANALALADEAGEWGTAIATGISYRQQGNLSLSIDLLTQARRVANTDDERMRATGELGATLLQARQFDQADVSLHEAYSFFSGIERAHYALDLGNLAVARKRQETAQRFYEEALQLAGSDAVVHVSAGLNLARIAAEPEKLKKLTALFQEIGNIDNASSRAPLYLNLGNQAHKLGNQATALTYQSLDQARQLLAKTAKSRLHVETLDALSQLYEDQGRKNEALTLAQQAATDAHTLAHGTVNDLLINIEGRMGRLYRATGKDELALAAYQRAVNQIETLRQDIPVEYEDGRSSFRYTLEPIYLGLVDLLLQEADKQPVDGRAVYLRRAIDTIELIKQSELQDYLGDRCTIETVKGGNVAGVPVETAALYPIIFNDRIELLLETEAGIIRKSIQISSSVVRKTAVAFASNLRDGDDNYLPQSKQLYDWLFRPLEESIAEQHIKTLVIVPDSALRLIAMGALHDGNSFAIEKFAIATVTGLSMTNTSAPAHAVKSLIAGASEFGPVVEKLSQAAVGQIFASDNSSKEANRGLARNRTIRSIRSYAGRSVAASNGDKVTRANALREALALPGVGDEVQAVSRILPGVSMLNAAFTIDDFRRNAESGAYRIVHIASHGVFSGSADTSYILAYDDVLTMDGFQSLLKSEHFHKNPIELLTLSACETAEGDERSPLGISGASIKARAKSVLGTLWPVEDNAARKVMEKFYGGLTATHLSKAEALKRAQVELIHTDEFANPFFWAPFVLIGNWL